ncbi:interleukin-1 receptor type 1 isoform X1 [Denticeps clupeoides]|nr:interleukin-1 receptor type 1-like isoform X1 [Denticeps clupeoides]
MTGPLADVDVAVLLLLLLLLTPRARAEDICHACVGHVVWLECNQDDESVNVSVTWRREGVLPFEEVPNTEIRGHDLWFLPAKSTHTGVYVCENGEELQNHVDLHVGTGPCPDVDAHSYAVLGTSHAIHCYQKHIFNVDPSAQVTWLKDCMPIQHSEKILRIPSVTEKDRGNYTCLLHFTMNGQNYTAAKTIQLRIDHTETVLRKPRVEYPGNVTQYVNLGSRVELTCVVRGKSLTMFWMYNNSLILTQQPIKKEYKEHGEVTHIISKVCKEHLNVPFVCVGENAAGRHEGKIQLIEADHSRFHSLVGLCVLSGLLAFAVWLCWSYRIDMVLVFRSLCPLVDKQQDDKSYDAYVSYPGDGQNVSKARTFALHVLPDVLEAHYGYRLFIRGRDAQLGEAVFDVVTKTLRKCRSLIIVLDESPMAKYTLADTDKSLKEDELIETQREVVPHNLNGTCGEMDTQRQMETHNSVEMATQAELEPLDLGGWKVGFERSVGIYEALVCSGLRVIIVQIGKGGGEEVLPPSLRLFTRNHKVLLWKTDIHNNIQTNQCGRFWKELRYEMPTVIKRNTYA